MKCAWHMTVFSSLMLSACAQQPVDVVFLGERFYGNAEQLSYKRQQLTHAQENVASVHDALPVGMPEVKPSAPANRAPIRSASLAPPAPSKAPAPKQKLATSTTTDKHVLQPGETLYRVSKRYNISLNELIASNDIKDVSAVPTGYALKLPTTESNMDSLAAAPAPKPIIPQASPAPKNLAAPAPSLKPQEVEPTKIASLQPARKIDRGGFMWPLADADHMGVLTHFGKHGGGMYNDGMNISARAGAPVMAAQNGRVIYAGNELQGYGNLVIIRHPDNFLTAYAHLKNIAIKRGDQVSKGAVVGHVGSTGSVSTPQLHFGLREGRKPVNPTKHLPSAPKWVASR